MTCIKFFLGCLALFLSINEVIASGVDWEKSIMMVEFSSESAFVPTFSCFGYEDRLTKSGLPADSGGEITACFGYGGAKDHCVWEYLSELGYDDENTDPDITDCFQQAGDYKASVYLKDYAGNLAAADVNDFTIKAGPPDPDESEFDADILCSDLSKTANAEDVCSISLKLKDEFGNPVTQLKGATGELYSAATFETDANKGYLISNSANSIKFRQGVKIKESTALVYSDIPTSAAPRFSFTIANNDEVSTQLDFISWTPSIQKHGAYLGKNIAFDYPFVVETPSVDESGALEIGTTIVYEYGQYSPAIGFRPWVKTALDVIATPPIFLLDTAIGMDIIRNLVLPAIGGPNTLVSIFLKHHNLNIGLSFDGVVFDPASIDTAQQTTQTQPKLKAASEDVVTLGSVAFSTEVSYSVDTNGDSADDTVIRYPSGALGSGIEGGSGADGYDEESLGTGSVGASIEGKLVGKNDKGLLQDYNAVRLGEIASLADIREEVFANAFRITRGLTPIAIPVDGNAVIFDPTWFSTSNVVLVEDVDVVMGSNAGTLTLPSGKNTLVIKNANLIVSGNYEYDEILDSMGLILINDAIATAPADGNVFVEEDVKRMVGTIYSEGTIATIPEIVMPISHGAVTTAHVDNRHAVGNTVQLLFEGTLLTHNTLGGALLLQFDTNYFTPWGDTAGATNSDFETAQKYDLNFMRYYRPEYAVGVQTNTADCVAGSNADGCDPNLNAVIIRYDGKATSLTPPGFENASFFGR